MIPNAGGGFGPQQNVWGGFAPQPNGNAGNLAGNVNVGNLMQGNLASSCSGGPPPGMWPGVGLSPNWNEAATNPVTQSSCCGDGTRQFGPGVGGKCRPTKRFCGCCLSLELSSLACCSSW